MKKRVMFKNDFLEINEEFVNEYKKEYYMKLGAYKQKLDDLENMSSFVYKKINKEQLVALVNSVISKRSTIGTQEMEGYSTNLFSIEKNNIEKTTKNKEEIIAVNIFRAYDELNIPNIIDNDFIKSIHYSFFNEYKSDYSSGKYRKKSDSDVGINSSSKIFIESRFVEKYMNNFISYMNNKTNIEPLTKAAMIHGIMLGIHPFKDGNGRVIRFITDKYLSKELEMELYLSESINNWEDKSEYVRSLNQFHLNLDSAPLIRFFYQIAINQLNININLINGLINDINNINRILIENGFEDKYINGITIALLSNAFVTRIDLSKHLDISKITATKLINRLMESNIINKPIEHGRLKIYLKTI